MTSKITEAVEQLNHSITTLRGGIPAITETIDEKRKQIAALRKEYFATYPKCLSGKWNIQFSREFNWVRLSGWKYADEGWDSVGTEEGNALFKAMGLPDDENWYLEHIPLLIHDDADDYGDASLKCEILFSSSDITITLHDMDIDAVVEWLNEHGIVGEFPGIEWKINDLAEERNELIKLRETIIDKQKSTTINTADDKEQSDD